MASCFHFSECTHTMHSQLHAARAGSVLLGEIYLVLILFLICLGESSTRNTLHDAGLLFCVATLDPVI